MTMMNLTMLPQSLQLSIISFLDLASLRSAMATHRDMRRTILSSAEARSFIWMEWYRRTWPSIDNECKLLVNDSLKQVWISTTKGTTAEKNCHDDNRSCDYNWSLILSMAPRHCESIRVESNHDDVMILHSALRFTGQVGTGERCVRTNHPLPRPMGRPFVYPFRGLNDDEILLTPRFVSYFEISIEKENDMMPQQETTTSPLLFRTRSACVAIGVATANYLLDRNMPGWGRLSFGYHGDDGVAYHGLDKRRYGPLFGPGDTVGCGVDYVSKSIFFTINGKFLGNAWANVELHLFERDLYPVVGVDIDAAVICNFGEKPFAFDLSTKLQEHADLVQSYLEMPTGNAIDSHSQKKPRLDLLA